MYPSHERQMVGRAYSVRACIINPSDNPSRSNNITNIGSRHARYRQLNNAFIFINTHLEQWDKIRHHQSYLGDCLLQVMIVRDTLPTISHWADELKPKL